jgi:hypothetical protein
MIVGAFGMGIAMMLIGVIMKTKGLTSTLAAMNALLF